MENCIASPHWEACNTCEYHGDNGCVKAFIHLSLHHGDFICCDEYKEAPTNRDVICPDCGAPVAVETKRMRVWVRMKELKRKCDVSADAGIPLLKNGGYTQFEWNAIKPKIKEIVYGYPRGLFLCKYLKRG